MEDEKDVLIKGESGGTRKQREENESERRTERIRLGIEERRGGGVEEEKNERERRNKRRLVTGTERRRSKSRGDEGQYEEEGREIKKKENKRYVETKKD